MVAAGPARTGIAQDRRQPVPGTFVATRQSFVSFSVTFIGILLEDATKEVGNYTAPSSRKVWKRPSSKSVAESSGAKPVGLVLAFQDPSKEQDSL